MDGKHFKGTKTMGERNQVRVATGVAVDET